MAYSNYGAFVYKNGIRQKDKEDACLWEEIPEPTSWEDLWMFHGVMGDGNVRVGCYKQGLPSIFIKEGDTISRYHFKEVLGLDYDDFGIVHMFVQGYEMLFFSRHEREHCKAIMITPEGDTWQCEYDYGYGAGITD